MTTESHEAEVRAMLQRRAADVHPSPGAWEAITDRIEAPAEATVLPFDRAGRVGSRRRAVGAAAAAAVAAATLGGAALLGSGPTSLVADAPEEAAPVTTVAPAPGPAETPIPAVWPEVTEESLRSFADANPFLLDPVETARTYLAERLQPPGGQPVELDELQQGDARSGSIRYQAGTDLGGEVLLRRLGGEGTPWYVVATVNDLLVPFPEVVDGRLVLSVTAEAPGGIGYEVATPDGEVLTEGGAAAAGRETVVLATVDGDEPVVTRARLVADGRLLAFLEVRTDPDTVEPSAPGPSGDPDVGGPTGEVEVPSTTIPTVTTVPAGDGALDSGTTVLLATDGFVLSSGAGEGPLRFGTDQAPVLATLTAVFGEPTSFGTDEECPPGPAEVATFADGLTATFQDGSFVGWTVRAPSPLTTSAGIGIGSTLGDVQAAQPATTVEETSLGWELTIGAMAAIVSGPSPTDVVENLMAGTSCIFR